MDKREFSSYLFPSPNTEFLRKVIALGPAYKTLLVPSCLNMRKWEENIPCPSESGLLYLQSDLFPCSGIYHVDKRDHGSENGKIFPVNLKQHLYKLLWHQHNTLKPQQLKRFISWALLQPHSLCFWHSQFAGCWWSNLPHSGSVIRMSMQGERNSLSDRHKRGWKGRICSPGGEATLSALEELPKVMGSFCTGRMSHNHLT